MSIEKINEAKKTINQWENGQVELSRSQVVRLFNQTFDHSIKITAEMHTQRHDIERLQCLKAINKFRS